MPTDITRDQSDGEVAEEAHGPLDPAGALEAVAYALERQGEMGYRRRAYLDAAEIVRRVDPDDLARMASAGALTRLPGIGDKTARVISEALQGKVPTYLAELEEAGSPAATTDAGAAVLAALRGDCHAHSTWSDGGDSIEAMALAAQALGRDYLVMTDHSPRLTIAHGLEVERLEAQLDEVAEVNERVAPFRVLTGCEVDILEDGALDHSDEMMSRLDVVVASVHSRFNQDRDTMTRRLVSALMNPHVDILGHCTGRKIVGRRPRPEYDFDHQMVFAAAAHLDKAVEINSRPERLDPPRRLLKMVADAGAKVAIDSDAHATVQLGWLAFGADRAAECGIEVDQVVNALDADGLLAWCGSHAEAATA